MKYLLTNPAVEEEPTLPSDTPEENGDWKEAAD
jgi:hypothetical protein